MAVTRGLSLGDLENSDFGNQVKEAVIKVTTAQSSKQNVWKRLMKLGRETLSFEGPGDEAPA